MPHYTAMFVLVAFQAFLLHASSASHLYGDVQEAVDIGQYLVTTRVGPTTQTLKIDTGSDLIWVQCNGSYTKLGSLASETLTIGNTTFPNVTMGCGHANRAPFAREVDGVLGLGRGPLSLATQSGAGGFSYCLDRDSNGWLEMSRSAFSESDTWIELIENPKRPGLYYVGLAGLEVGGEAVKGIPRDAFEIDRVSGGGGAVVDSGETFTRLEGRAYRALRGAFRRKVGGLLKPAKSNREFDTCYNVSGVDFEETQVPGVTFVFSTKGVGSPVVKVDASVVLVDQGDGRTACFAFGSIDDKGPSVIGNKQQETFQVNFDTSRGYVSFVPDVC